jgi:hypothetical protein
MYSKTYRGNYLDERKREMRAGGEENEIKIHLLKHDVKCRHTMNTTKPVPLVNKKCEWRKHL